MGHGRHISKHATSALVRRGFRMADGAKVAGLTESPRGDLGVFDLRDFLDGGGVPLGLYG